MFGMSSFNLAPTRMEFYVSIKHAQSGIIRIFSPLYQRGRRKNNHIYPKQNGSHFADNVCKSILVWKWSYFDSKFQYLPKGPFNHKVNLEIR